MATKPTINSLASSSRFTTSGLNQRFTTLKDEFANVLGTDGMSGSDNTMTGNLNMGGYQIKNLAAPTVASDAARKSDIENLQTQIDTLDTTGILPNGETAKVSDNDTTSGFLSDKITAGTGIAITVTEDGGNEHLEISNTFAGDNLALLLTTAEDASLAEPYGISSDDITPHTLLWKIRPGEFINYGLHEDTPGDWYVEINATPAYPSGIMMDTDGSTWSDIDSSVNSSSYIPVTISLPARSSQGNNPVEWMFHCTTSLGLNPQGGTFVKCYLETDNVGDADLVGVNGNVKDRNSDAHEWMIDTRTFGHPLEDVAFGQTFTVTVEAGKTFSFTLRYYLSQLGGTCTFKNGNSYGVYKRTSYNDADDNPI